MFRPPRQPKTERLTNWLLVCHAYLQIGILEVGAGFLVYFTIMSENGFLAKRLFGLRSGWDQASNNELMDSYGQQWVSYKYYKV